MESGRPLKIGITCYPSVGGSGILASALGEELARRGHEAHFISYERPFRLPADAPRLFYHPVAINDYGLFKYPDYTLPLSVKMAEVSRDFGLDVLHVHYAVPHATAAILAQAMLPPNQRGLVWRRRNEQQASGHRSVLQEIEKLRHVGRSSCCLPEAVAHQRRRNKESN